MSKPSQRFRKRLWIVCLLGAVLLLGSFFAPHSSESTVTYSGKPLEVWFYGTRDNFSQEPTRKQAQEAIDALGTNAFPFLLANLKEKRGDGNLYFRAFQAAPKWIQARAHYPLLDDDIKVITLNHMHKIPRVTATQVQELADCIPSLANPRVRLSAFNLIRMNHQTHPAFLILCRQLVDDKHQGIRLEAAISLAELAIASDPDEPKLFPILIAALESKEEREPRLEVTHYHLQQQPPGGSGTFAMPRVLPGLQPQDEALRARIESAMYRLERLMSHEHRVRFRQAIKY